MDSGPLVCVALWSGYRRREIVVLASLFAGYLAYVVAVGGDFKGTYRFFVPTTVEEFSGRFAVERQLLVLPDFQRNCKLVNEPLAGGYLYLFRRRTD